MTRTSGLAPWSTPRDANLNGDCSDNSLSTVLQAAQPYSGPSKALARGLTSRSCGTIALVGSDLTNPFVTSLAEDLQRMARSRGWTMFCASLEVDADSQREMLESLWSREVDGVIVLPSLGLSLELLVDYARRGLPMVVINDVVDAPNVASVYFDVAAGVRLAVQHLLDADRCRIGMIGPPLSPRSSRCSERGFRAAVRNARGAEFELMRARATIDSGKAVLGELLELRPDLDGVFAYSDLVAIGASHEAAARGRRVPEDIAVVGVGGIEMGALVTPTLTTVRFDLPRLVRTAALAFHELFDIRRRRLDPVVLPIELVVRESTREWPST